MTVSLKAIRSQKSNLIRLLLILLLGVLIILPLGMMLGNIRGDDLSFVFNDPAFWESLGNSFLYSGLSALISTCLALTVSYFLHRADFKHKRGLVFALTLPMLIPTLSIGLGVRSMFGTNGFLDKLFGINFNGLGMFGLVFASVISSFPVVFTIVYDAMAYEDRRVYDSAEVLGIKKRWSFIHVTLPFIWKSLISAFFAGFTWVFSDYGIPMEVAGRTKTLPMYLYEQVLTQFNYGRGAVIGVALLIPAVAAFIVNLLTKEGATQESAEALIQPNKGFKVASGLVAGITFVFLFLPQLCFISLAFIEAFPSDMGFTLRHFADGFTSNAGLGIGKYLGNSFLIALLTALFGVVAAYLCAYFSVRLKGKLGVIVRFLALLTLAIPGLVFGLGYVFAFKGTSGWFYRTFAILVAVNVVHFFSTPYLMACNALEKMNKDYETVGDTIGVSKARVFFHVLLPNSKSTLVEMFSFFFVNAMITISAVAFLCTYSNQPLSIMISTFDKQGSYEMQAVVSVIILVANVLTKVLLSALSAYFKKKESKKEGTYMALTRFEFALLAYLEKNGPGKYTQRKLADDLTVSVGLINKMLRQCEDANMIQVSEDRVISISEHGLQLLEPYKVRKAIVVAAGFGSRLAPVTLKTPKPLVTVNGVRIIDTLLDALLAAGITSIFIVRGYKGEQFDTLLEKYPMIRFVENPLYNESNNISSVYAAKDLIDRCYICEADLIISDPSIITKYQYESNYLACPVKETDDWCFETKSGYIKSVAIGGEDVEQMVGISYWGESDSIKLRADLEKVWNSRGGKENYWDNVPLKICKKNYHIGIRECARGTVTEIDNYSELVVIDPHYANFGE